MKAIFTIIIATIAMFSAFTANAQSSVKTATVVTSTLANDNISSVGATTFAKKTSASRELFSSNQNAKATRLFITNVATGEVLVSNTMEIANDFSTEKMNDLEIATIATEREVLEILP